MFCLKGLNFFLKHGSCVCMGAYGEDTLSGKYGEINFCRINTTPFFDLMVIMPIKIDVQIHSKFINIDVRVAH